MPGGLKIKRKARSQHMMFSGSGVADDSCSQQSNSTRLQAYAAACTSQQLQKLPNSGGYLLDAGMGSLSPVKPSHLTLPQALKLPQPPHILTSFGALSLRNPPHLSSALPEHPPTVRGSCCSPALQSSLGSAAGHGEGEG